MPTFYIAVVEISPAVAQKIQSKHGITPAEVREACDGYERAGWHVHAEHGRRLLVTGRTGHGRVIKAILQPVDALDGSWRLRTALEGTSGRVQDV